MTEANNDVIQIDSDSDDDEQLRHAIALSLQDQNGQQEDNKQAALLTETSPQETKAQFGSLYLDRKAMEEERLQRLTKRARSMSDAGEVNPPKRPSTGRYLPPPTLSCSNSQETRPSPDAPDMIVPYPNGTVKRTWVRGFDRRGDDIKIEEVLQRDKLKLAVISSFQWDEEWMMSKIDMTKTNVLLLAYAKDDAQKETMRANVPPNIRFCFPPMCGPGAMHSKLQLLKYGGYLRIVVPTGNFVPYDWGETGVMENMVFLIDLPKRPPETVGQRPTRFKQELEYFLKAMGVNEQTIASMANYDFAKTENIGFVHTIPGGHMDESQARVGLCGLGASVAALGLASTEPVEVDLACSSLGSLNRELIAAMFQACQGNDGVADNCLAMRSRRVGGQMAATIALLRDRFRIYFPTNKTVSRSRGGRQAGGTICTQARWWRSPSFPTELMRDLITTRDRLLVHSKVIFVRRRRRRLESGEMMAGESPGWAYVGSANLSESAWGRVSRDKTTGKTKLSCRNWECGVVIPLPEDDQGGRNMGASDMSMFEGTVPIPMQAPGPVYGLGDEPWFFSGA